ncbi:hypothetical protein TNIN_362961 [Trichonephila inaurata madagascariensis]|uniref:Uncharacterized protein n=1 Tax=Trichonephila inaurata madagascariensis TaxID=2747483 RepID=A0A8X6M5L7_9ARAC|nr:hypothetical protein TNIN_362961 [Trichonephila inaurata madagascariensis]
MDTLSRINEITMPGPIDYNEIASAQLDDNELINLLNSDNFLQLKKLKIPNSDLELYCDMLTDTDGPYPVIKCSDKFYKVNIYGKPTSISIDRLKPAFTHNGDDTLNIEMSDAETKPNLRKTRSGRRAHFPDYFVSSR